MAEGFEPYHVPQQSRREKLRIVAQNNPELHASASLLPLNYDPTSLLSSDLLASCPNSLVVGEACNKQSNTEQHNSSVKEEASGSGNLMGFFGGVVNVSSSSSSPHHHHQHVYLDPHSSLHINHSSTSIHNTNNQNNSNNNNNPFLYSALQGLRGFEHNYNHGGGSGDVVGFKHEPLSLSLSSHHTHHQSNNLPLEPNLQRYGSTIYRDLIPAGIVGGTTGSTSYEVSRISVPLGPFTGYASILKGSRFLRPAQQLLEEFCDVGRGIYGGKVSIDGSLMEPPIECLNTSGIGDDSSSSDGSDIRRKKSRLISMLDEVYRRYKHYYQQMQAVVESFECVAGLGNAAPYANLALKAMSKHVRSLKSAITDQLQFTSKAHGQLCHGKDEAARYGSSDKGVYSRSIQTGYIDHNPVWRPQRGLPERAVTVLRAWLFEHFLHPYPTDTDKMMLAKQTGLSRSQVSNWFINARVRLWKPMVEEIHTLETRQAQKAAQKEERNANKNSGPVASSSSVAMDNPSTSNQRSQDAPSKRTRNDLPELPMGSEAPLNLPYNNLSGQHHGGIGIGMGVGSTGVSLTLGLHQNNGMGLSEPFPISAAQRFGLGLEANNQGFVMEGFEAQNRHFGRDVMGGQLLHDFVG